MSNRSFGPIGDYRVSSLSCYDHTVLDSGCNLDVANVRALTICAEALKSRNPDQPLRILSNISALGTLYVADNVIFDSNLAVNKSVVIEQDLIVGGNTIFEGNVAIEGCIVSDLCVKGAATIQDDLLLEGNICVGEHAVFKGDLTVKGPTTLEGDLLVEGNLTVEQNTVFKGDTIFEGNVNIGGGAVLRIWQATANSGQTVESGELGNVVIFDTPNPHNILSPGTWNGNTTFTVNADSWYLLEAGVDLGNIIDNKFGLDFLINGAENGNVCIGDSRLHSTGLPARMHLNCTSWLDDGDAVSVRARQTTGSPHSIEGAIVTIQRIG